jgi:hypothetical protein
MLAIHQIDVNLCRAGLLPLIDVTMQIIQQLGTISFLPGSVESSLRFDRLRPSDQ